MPPIQPLDRIPLPTVDTRSASTIAAAETIAPPASHSAVTDTINVKTMRQNIDACRGKLDTLQGKMIEKTTAFKNAIVRKEHTPESVAKARDHAREVAQAYETMLDQVNDLIQNSIKKVKGGVVPKYQKEFSEFAGKARDFNEQRHVWYAYVKLLGSDLDENAFDKGIKRPNVLPQDILPKLETACAQLEEAENLLKLVPANKSILLVRIPEIYRKYDLNTAAALQCHVHRRLCEAEFKYIWQLNKIKEGFSLQGRNISASLRTATSEERKNAELKNMGYLIVNYSQAIEPLYERLGKAQKNVKEYGQPTPQPRTNPAQFRTEWDALMQITKKYDATYDPIRKMEPVSSFELVHFLCEYYCGIFSNSDPELKSCLEKIKHNLDMLRERYATYIDVMNWIQCREEGLSSKFAQAIIKMYGWDKTPPPSDANCTPDKRYAALYPLLALFEKGVEHLLRIGAALEVELKPRMKTDEAKANTTQAMNVAKDLASALDGMASHVRTILDELIKEGASTTARDVEDESRLEQSIDWNIEGIYDAAPADEIDDADESEDATLASAVETISLDGSTASRPRPNAPANTMVERSQPVKILTEQRKQNFLDNAKALTQHARDYRDHANDINQVLSNRISDWLDGTRKADNIRDDRNKPMAVESQMHFAAEKLEKAAGKLERLVKEMKAQPDAADRETEIADYSKQAKELRQDAATLREDGTGRCLELIAEMPTEKDLDYLVGHQHIERIDQPTYAPIVKRDRETNEVIWGDDGEPLKDYLHEYNIHLKNGSSFVAHLRYESEDADPSTAPSFAEHFKTTRQARLGYQSQVRAKEQNLFYESIWRGGFDPGKVVPMLQSFLDEDKRMPLPEQVDNNPVVI